MTRSQVFCNGFQGVKENRERSKVVGKRRWRDTINGRARSATKC